jgi:hypothetical protein
MLDTLKIARDLTHEQGRAVRKALATYCNEIRSELVTKEYSDARLSQLETRLEAKFETKLAQVQNRLLAPQIALFVLLGIAILLK